MAQQRTLRDWKQGDRFSAEHLNEAIDMLRPLSSIMGGGITEVTQFPEGTAIYTPEQSPVRTGFFPVKVECENPTATGDATTQASFVYTVRRQDWAGTGISEDYEYGTNVAPTHPRPTVGRMKAQAGDQGIGQAYYDENGGFHLYDAGEVMDFEPCET